MKELVLSLVIAGAFILPAAGGTDAVVSYTYYCTVENAERSVSAVRDFTRSEKGYVKRFSGSMVVMRLPAGATGRLRELLTRLGYIADERTNRADITAELTELESQLAVKKKLLEELNALFSGSTFHQTIDIEKEIGSVIIEIERLKGQIALKRDQAGLAEITVYVNQKVTGKKEKGTVPAQWIRGLGIDAMMKDW